MCLRIETSAVGSNDYHSILTILQHTVFRWSFISTAHITPALSFARGISNMILLFAVEELELINLKLCYDQKKKLLIDYSGEKLSAGGLTTFQAILM